MRVSVLLLLSCFLCLLSNVHPQNFNNLAVGTAALGGLLAGVAVGGLLTIAAARKARYFQQPDRYNYNRGYNYRWRNRREVLWRGEGAVFQEASRLDVKGCGLRLVCELETYPEDKLGTEESLILSLFRDLTPSSGEEETSATARYHSAALLGSSSRDPEACQKRYSFCLYSAENIMSALTGSPNSL